MKWEIVSSIVHASKLQISHQVLAHKHGRDARTGHSMAEAFWPNLVCLEAHGQAFCTLCLGLSQVPRHLVAGHGGSGGLQSAAFCRVWGHPGTLLVHAQACTYRHAPQVLTWTLLQPGARFHNSSRAERRQFVPSLLRAQEDRQGVSSPSPPTGVSGSRKPHSRGATRVAPASGWCPFHPQEHPSTL